MNIENELGRYGQTVSLHLPDGWSSGDFGAMIRPLRYKNKMYLDGVNTQIGFNAQGHYLYIGPSTHDITLLADGAWILSHGIKYRIDRAEKVRLGDSVLFIWAIIRTIVEAETEGNE